MQSLLSSTLASIRLRGILQTNCSHDKRVGQSRRTTKAASGHTEK